MIASVFLSALLATTPCLSWRGLHLDESRHFFGKEAVCRFVDRMSSLGYNTFHWHLTDHHGWRIEIKRYPKLTQDGAVRRLCDWKGRIAQKWLDEGVESYGPYFYTQDEAREIVAYAAARGVTVVPEIELPGHVFAALCAYPELGCPDELARLEELGVKAATLCAGTDETLRFFEGVLDEVCDIFPSPFVHLGGDEVCKDVWKGCPRCQARMKRLGLEGEDALQGWLMRHFAGYLKSKGRRMVGWDEILDDALPKDVVVMCWRGHARARLAAEAGYDVVLCPEEFCYFDFRQSEEDDGFRYHPKGRLFEPVSAEKVRRFDPYAGLSRNLRSHVLGAQANNWTEYTPDERTLDHKLWKRAEALSSALSCPRKEKP